MPKPKPISPNRIIVTLTFITLLIVAILLVLFKTNGKSEQVENSSLPAASVAIGISREKAVKLVESQEEVVDYLKRVPNGLVSVNGEEDDKYMVQVYEIKDGHTATFNWYSVDKTSGEILKQF